MVVPLAQESGEICTAQVVLQPISFKSDRMLSPQGRMKPHGESLPQRLIAHARIGFPRHPKIATAAKPDSGPNGDNLAGLAIAD